MDNDSDVSRMCDLLSVTAAPLVMSGIATTLAFFRSQIGVDPFDWFDYIRAIDFHKAVKAGRLRTGMSVSRHRSLGSARQKPFVYFTKPGTSQYSTGTSFAQSQYELFEAVSCPVLISRAADIKFGPTDRVTRSGGGIQYIVSSRNAKRFRQVH